MKDWQIEVAIFDSGKQVHFQVQAHTLIAAKTAALRELRKFVPGRKNLYLEARGQKVYTVVSDLYDVGCLSLHTLEQVAERSPA